MSEPGSVGLKSGTDGTFFFGELRPPLEDYWGSGLLLLGEPAGTGALVARSTQQRLCRERGYPCPVVVSAGMAAPGSFAALIVLAWTCSALNVESPREIMGVYPHEPAMFGIQATPDTLVEARGDLVWVTPRDGCGPITNANISGNIAVIDQGLCVFERKAFQAQEANASAVIIVFSDETIRTMAPALNLDPWGNPNSGHPLVNPYFSNVFIPVIGITRSLGDTLKDHFWYKKVRVHWTEDYYAAESNHDMGLLQGRNDPGP